MVLKHLKKGACVVFRCDFEQWYLPGKPLMELLVAVWTDERDEQALSLMLVPASKEAEKGLSDFEVDLVSEATGLAALASVWQTPVINLAEPLLLEPVAIAKPWGQEIWYTGMEKRGLSLVTDGRHSMPLAWLVGLFPGYLMGATADDNVGGKETRTPNLLKILDPLPEPIYGDLYFELHEQKREVYVVTDINTQAWPEGVGRIRYGFSGVARARYDSEDQFRSAYLQAVSAYRVIRQKIDDYIDVMRIRDGIELNQPVPATQTKSWLAALSADMVTQEIALREEMDSFTELKPLRLGDIVKVPLLTPHALQHGVRTVEFQTPVYERKILSFGQKVLTQAHWDTAEALKLIPLEAEADPGLDLSIERVTEGESSGLKQGVSLQDTSSHDKEVKWEQVVVFEGFQVQRITLKPQAATILFGAMAYSLVMTIQGALNIDGQEIGQEQAVFVPASRTQVELKNLGTESCVVLVSQPFNKGR